MLCNLHTHSIFCDGNNTPEEIVISAIEQGFDSIGFSGHGYTPFDLRYCMKDTEGYKREVNALKEKYKDKIQIYLGVEEDAFNPLNRDEFDYIIGSSHYFNIDGNFYPIDSNYDCFKECLKAFDYDIKKLTHQYYTAFCDYILKRKPDIIGHFDLITKFDEIDVQRFLNNEDYLSLADFYVKEALKADVIFEVNTGAISRNLRTTPYPHERLLHIIKNNGGKVMLGADSHQVETLCFGFEEARKMLSDIGFEHIYTLYNNEFKKEYLR